MNELNKIIYEIANIQLRALKILQKDPHQISYDNLSRYIYDWGTSIQRELQNRIDFWEKVQKLPHTFKQVDEYQLGLSSHILFTMESEWVKENAQGVTECWELIDNLYQQYHPETQFIWKLQNLSPISRN